MVYDWSRAQNFVVSNLVVFSRAATNLVCNGSVCMQTILPLPYPSYPLWEFQKQSKNTPPSPTLTHTPRPPRGVGWGYVVGVGFRGVEEKCSKKCKKKMHPKTYPSPNWRQRWLTFGSTWLEFWYRSSRPLVEHTPARFRQELRTSHWSPSAAGGALSGSRNQGPDRPCCSKESIWHHSKFLSISNSPAYLYWSPMCNFTRGKWLL